MGDTQQCGNPRVCDDSDSNGNLLNYCFEGDAKVPGEAAEAVMASGRIKSHDATQSEFHILSNGTWS